MISLIRSSFVLSSPTLSGCPTPDKSEFVCIGRSNVGKSSLINTLCSKKEFAKTSAKPGKTQLINYFSLEIDGEQGSCLAYLVDLPGYGYAKSSKQSRHERSIMIEEYLLGRESITQIYVLIDSRISPQAIDLDFIQRLSQEGRPYSIVFTKADKRKIKELNDNIKTFMFALSKLVLDLPSYHITSALDKSTIKSTLEAMYNMTIK